MQSDENVFSDQLRKNQQQQHFSNLKRAEIKFFGYHSDLLLSNITRILEVLLCLGKNPLNGNFVSATPIFFADYEIGLFRTKISETFFFQWRGKKMMMIIRLRRCSQKTLL